MPHFSIDPDKSIACCQKQLADLAIEKRMLQAHTENTLAALAKRQHDNEAILAEDQKKSREFRDKRSLLQEHQEKLTMAQAEYSRAEARYQLMPWLRKTPAASMPSRKKYAILSKKNCLTQKIN